MMHHHHHQHHHRSSRSRSRRISLDPPVINSSSPWATSLEHLSALYCSPYTGAITTRTSLVGATGFPHDDTKHRFTFVPVLPPTGQQTSSNAVGTAHGAINTFGYSPHPLQFYLDLLPQLVAVTPTDAPPKPVIISITCDPSEIPPALLAIAQTQTQVQQRTPPLWVELNLSCPNIPDAPPPAYDKMELLSYIQGISNAREILRKKTHARQSQSNSVAPAVVSAPAPAPTPAPATLADTKIGIKTPPYTYLSQFQSVIDALEKFPDAVDFITACNTLGSSLAFVPSPETQNRHQDILLGGLSGPSLHPLALGNVHTLRSMLDSRPGLEDIAIIGVGGVCDAEGFERMRAAGADVIGLGVGLGVQVEMWGVEEGVRRAFTAICMGGGEAKVRENT